MNQILSTLLVPAVIAASTVSVFAAEADTEYEKASGTITDTAYINEIAGIELTFRDDWIVYTPEEVAEIFHSGYDTPADELAEEGGAYIFAADFENGDGFIDIWAQNYNGIYDETDWVIIKAATLAQSEEAYVFYDYDTIEIGEEEHAVFSFSLGTEDDTVYYTQLIIQRDEYVYTLEFASTESMDAIDELIESVSYYEEDLDQTYKSEFYGLKASFPDNWILYTGEEAANLQQLPAIPEGVNYAAVDSMICDFVAIDPTRDPYGSVSLVYYPFIYLEQTYTEEEFLDEFTTNMMQSMMSNGYSFLSVSDMNTSFAGEYKNGYLFQILSAEGTPCYRSLIVSEKDGGMLLVQVEGITTSVVNDALSYFEAY